MGFSPFDKESKIGTMDEEKEALDTVSSDSSGLSSVVSSESNLMEDEEVTSSVSSPSPPPSSSSSASNSSGEIAISSPLQDMSSLMHQLPLKRGLSKYFQGKSQSFTSLTSVTSLEDLAKPENPYNKKLKSCKSYGGLYLSDHQNHTSSPHLPRAHSSSRFITKKGYNSRGSCSSLGAKRTPSFIGNRTTPISSLPPHGSTTTSGISNHTPLFV